MFSGGYHILIIPDKAEKTRRIHFSSLAAKLLMVMGLLILPLMIGSFLGVVHYQNKLVSLKQKISEERQIVEQKELMATRLGGLERSISHTQQSLQKLESALDLDTEQVKSGVGPIDLGTTLEKENGREMAGDEFSLRRFRGEMNQMESRIADLNSKIEQVYDLNQDKIRFMDAIPASMPVEGWITSGFGFRKNPYSGIYRMHYGVDIASAVGTPIHAPSEGRVILAESEAGYGEKIILDHSYGVATIYAHASKLFVREGQIVKKGQVIAAVGSTGSSTGPHLHYEIHIDGIPADPLNYLLK